MSHALLPALYLLALPLAVAEKPDQELIQGEWILASVEADGKELTDPAPT
ncbi:MAG TPA: hypothetical protein VMS17_25125 [Gemmataceae bacterium]|nr:hypothetical protein [Gemmataceae bacterium]